MELIICLVCAICMAITIWTMIRVLAYLSSRYDAAKFEHNTFLKDYRSYEIDGCSNCMFLDRKFCYLQNRRLPSECFNQGEGICPDWCPLNEKGFIIKKGGDNNG